MPEEDAPKQRTQEEEIDLWKERQAEMQERADKIEKLGYMPADPSELDDENIANLNPNPSSNQDETTPPEAEPSPNPKGSKDKK